MTPPPRILIMGATGLVGRELLAILLERDFPHREIVAIASPASAGQIITIADRRFTVVGSDPALFQRDDLVFFTGHDDLAADLAPKAVAAGATVIDNSATFRMDPAVPLVIPEINPEAALGHDGLIANPNCTTATFIVPLAILHRAFGTEWVSVASYQAISGAGTPPYHAFRAEMTAAVARDFTDLDPGKLPFNLGPVIGGLDAEGITSEEAKMSRETRKIIGDDSITVIGTAMRVPVLVSHTCVVHLRTVATLPSYEALCGILADAPGIALRDERSTTDFPTPLLATGTDPVWVGRVRRIDDHTLAFIAIADNLRKGAGLNAVQIAELLLSREALAPAHRRSHHSPVV